MGVRKESDKMLKTNTIERTERGKALSVNGNGRAQGLRTAQSLYRQIAALASELGRIERELRDSQAWLHEGLCDCEQCLHELARQRRLLQARNRLLAELDALNAAVANVDVEQECLRCAQPFTPVDDEQLCSTCYSREYGPRR
jgi:septal ring factor EnvC (AmiA/AmiB activator)